MKITSELPDHAACCEAVLIGFVECARLLIRAGMVPPYPTDVVGVFYRLEPEGSEDWKLPHNVIRDGWGDCEDMAIWLAAGLRETGEDPLARCRIVRTARGKLHCVVERGDGTFEDPSIDMMDDAHLRRYTDAR